MTKYYEEEGLLDGAGKSQRNARKNTSSITTKNHHKYKSSKGLISTNDIKYGKHNDNSKKGYKKLSVSEKIRIASGFDQAVLKVTSYGKNKSKILAHLAYISRANDLHLEDDKGNQLLSEKDVNELIDSWQDIYFDSRANTRHTFHFVLSAPPGTERQVFREASKQFLSDEFGNKHEYVFAQHDDTDHPHIHVVVCMRAMDGRKLDPRKKTLNLMRKNFAEKCRESGIMLDASRRYERGLSGKSVKSELVQMRQKRGVQPDVDARLLLRIREELEDQSLISNTASDIRETRNKSIKSQFYDTAKSLYMEYKKSPNDEEYSKYIKAAKMLFDYSKSMPDEKSRDEIVRELILENSLNHSQFDFLGLEEKERIKKINHECDVEI